MKKLITILACVLVFSSCWNSLDKEKTALEEKNKEVQEKIDNLHDMKNDIDTICRFGRDEINYKIIKIGDFSDKTMSFIEGLVNKDNLSFINILDLEGECFKNKENIILLTDNTSYELYSSLIPYLKENNIHLIYSIKTNNIRKINYNENITLEDLENLAWNELITFATSWITDTAWIWEEEICYSKRFIEWKTKREVNIFAWIEINKDLQTAISKCEIETTIWKISDIKEVKKYIILEDYINNL